jgi:hypothetical protein
MGFRKMMLVAACVTASLFGFQPSEAGKVCVTYDVTAPVVGPHADERCTPDVSPFTAWQSIVPCNEDGNVPYRVCVGIRAHLPL